MEYNQLIHRPFAKGRIEKGLPPAPRKEKRPLHRRWADAISCLAGRSVAVRVHEDEEPEEGEPLYLDGTLYTHPLIPRK